MKSHWHEMNASALSYPNSVAGSCWRSLDVTYTWTTGSISSPSVLWHCWLGDRTGIQPVEVRWRFAGGDYLTGALHVLQLHLLSPPLSSVAPIKSRMETFWYELTQLHLEKPGAYKGGHGGLAPQWLHDSLQLTILWCQERPSWVCWKW